MSGYKTSLTEWNLANLLSADAVWLKQWGEDAFRQIVESKEVKVLRGGDTVSVSIPGDLVTQLLQAKKGFAGERFPFVVDSVLSNSPAEHAGLIPGDSIVAVNDSVALQSDCIAAFASHKGKPVLLTLVRQGREEKITIVPDNQGKVGVYMKTPYNLYPVQKITYGFIESIPAGIKKGIKKLTGNVSDMKYVFTREGFESMGGFKAMLQFFSYPFDAQIFWTSTAFFSIVLAFMNILPIPALDGGHVMFLLYEVITRRKPSQRVMEIAQMAGMLFLITLMIYVNLNDWI